MLLQMENVYKNRGDGYELHIDSLAVSKGERVAITGPSGCGKSTTLDIIGMVLDPSLAGRFIFSPDEEKYNVAALWEDDSRSSLTELRRKHMGYVLQTGEIFSFLNVRENIELTALAAGLGQEVASERAADLLDRLDLKRVAAAMPATLSIGQRQRVAIARALAPRPNLILADEPTSALDPGLSRKVMGLMLDAVEDYGATLIMVSHDLGLVSEFSFRQAPIVTKPVENGIHAILGGK